MPKICLLTHFMGPDDVVSARLFDGLAEDLAQIGWQVEARPSTRSCHHKRAAYLRKERRGDVQIRRVWRPDFSQHRMLGRLLNTLWMLCAWMGVILRPRARRPEAVLIGSDPIFAALLAYPLRFFCPDIKLIHWAFDLHPEAAVASGMLRPDHPLARMMARAMTGAYRRFDLIFDLGPCMRARLKAQGTRALMVEAAPWAQSVPAALPQVDTRVRAELFGQAQLGVLYSGTFGQAHPIEPVVALVRALRGSSVHFAFAVRGARAEALRNAFGPGDTNVSFAGFAALEVLPKRLAAADLHLACLEPEFAGIAVPSKVLGSWAAGRPVLFAGPAGCAASEWIKAHGLGWVLDTGDARGVEQAAQMLRSLLDEPSRVAPAQARAFATYAERFSQEATTRRMADAMASLLDRGAMDRGGRDVVAGKAAGLQAGD